MQFDNLHIYSSKLDTDTVKAEVSYSSWKQLWWHYY